LRPKPAAFAPGSRGNHYTSFTNRVFGSGRLRDYLDIRGASGTTYRFLRLKDGRPLSPMGGNFVYARFTGDRFDMILAGEAQNLLKDARDRWNEAVERYQVSDLYSRLNISERVRLLELADIVDANHPAMNVVPDRKAG
jgi:hypothetical protein